jgi:hypothetical protein
MDDPSHQVCELLEIALHIKGSLLRRLAFDGILPVSASVVTCLW